MQLSEIEMPCSFHAISAHYGNNYFWIGPTSSLGFLANGENIRIEKILKEGDSFRFPPGAVHQEEAITDCLIIEASTPHYNDRVRVEKEYGLTEEPGLQSTTKNEVKYL